MRNGLLNQIVFLEGQLARILHGRVEFDQCDLISMFAGISLKQFCYRHVVSFSSLLMIVAGCQLREGIQ